LAGKKAEKKASINDAIAHAKKRVESLERMPQTDDVPKRLIDARTVLGLYYIQLNHMVEAKEAVDVIIDSAIKIGYKRRLSHIYTIMGAYNCYKDDLPEAFKYLENALRIGEELNDPILALSNTFMGLAHLFNCEFAKALHYTEKALEINVAANVLWGIVAMKTHLTSEYHFYGKVNLGYKASEEALRIAMESGDIYSEFHAEYAFGQSCYYSGFFEEAEEHLLITSDLAERTNMFSIAGLSNYFLGETYFAMGEYKKSEKHYERAVTFYCMVRIFPSFVNLNKMLLAKAKVMRNEDDIDLREILKYHEETKMNLAEAWMESCVGSILLNIDDQHLSEAEDWINKAIETYQKYGMMWDLAQDYALYAELYKRKGDPSKARENLNKAINILKECGADGWVERYEKELASLS
jgi:tetratricopeptide (TPR) repeat protein